MNLYYALTGFHQMECLLHKMLLKPEEPAHLYISSNTVTLQFIDKIKESKLFDEVTIMYEEKAWQIGSKVKNGHTERFDDVMIEITKLCLSSLLLPLDEYQNKYIFADHFPFGMVLAYNKIPYYYFEEATGAHSRRNILLEEIRQKNEFWYLAFVKLGVRGESEWIIEKNIDFEYQLNDFFDEKAIDFSVTRALNKLSPVQKKLLLSIFGADNIVNLNNNKKRTLILTQHYAAASLTTYAGQKLLYTLLADYFACDMDIIIKPHPTDTQGIYSQWFPSAVILNKDMPAELLPYCLNSPVDLTITATSSTAYNLKEISNKVRSFDNIDNRFNNLFYFMSRYYTISRYIKLHDKKTIVYSYGADFRQLEHFFDLFKIESTLKEMSEITISHEKKAVTYIIDNPVLCGIECRTKQILAFLQRLKKEDVVFFIDSGADALFCNPHDTSWAMNIVPIQLRHIAMSGEVPEELMKREWIYMYSKNKEILKEGLLMNVNKMLENTGVELKVGYQDGQLREQVLEGFLNATEEKCLRLANALKQSGEKQP